MPAVCGVRRLLGDSRAGTTAPPTPQKTARHAGMRRRGRRSHPRSFPCERANRRHRILQALIVLAEVREQFLNRVWDSA